jgi:hypothetical protein
MRTWVLLAGILILAIGAVRLLGNILPSDAQSTDMTISLGLLAVGAVVVVVSLFIKERKA